MLRNNGPSLIPGMPSRGGEGIRLDDPRSGTSRNREKNGIKGHLAALAGVAAGLLLAAAGFGQTRGNEVSAHFGVVSSDQVIDILSDPPAVVLRSGIFDKARMSFSAVPFLSYRRWVTGRLAFGAAAGAFGSSGALVPAGGGDGGGDFRERNYVLAAEIRYLWAARRTMAIYSGAGFGFKVRRGTYATGGGPETSNETLPTFHLNALGMRAGSKIAFFAEAGYGYKGVFSAGLEARF